MASSSDFETRQSQDLKHTAQHVEITAEESNHRHLHHELNPEAKLHGDRALALLGDERIELTEEDVRLYEKYTNTY